MDENYYKSSAYKNKPEKNSTSYIEVAFELIEQFAFVCAIVLVMFAFVVRLNIVNGTSMDNTLAGGQKLAVSSLFYKPKAGDIVVIHDITATPYNSPIVKRVIATGGQTVDIDFDTWTLTVDGEIVDESAYRYLNPDTPLLRAEYKFPITVPEGEIFVLGDNRNDSADSRQIEIGTIDARCVVGRAVARLTPLTDVTIFKNPYAD